MARLEARGVAMTPQGRLAEGPAELAAAVAGGALADAATDAREIGLVVVANALGGLLCEQECVRGQSWLRAVDLGTAHVVNVDNGCAAGSSAFHIGCLVARAERRPVLVVAVEKMWTGDRTATLNGIENCLPADVRADMRSAMQGTGGSVFMELNAGWAASQITHRGHTVEQFAAAAAKAYRHAALNPRAQHQIAHTANAVLASPAVAGPLTRLMCSSFTDGAAAVVLDIGSTGAPYVRSNTARSGNASADYHARMADVAAAAYVESGLDPSDLDVIELHDATSAEELYALECLGVHEAGEAGWATERGDTTFGGKGPLVNPSGGLVARGHPIGATGLCQIVELVTQLRGLAGTRQRDGARFAFAVNTGGIVEGDIGAICMSVLARDRTARTSARTTA
jgi:acetyl-CoA acyltransferase